LGGPASGGRPLLEARGLVREFPVRGARLPGRARRVVHAVSDVSFTLAPGETFGLVGESGCGKTTLGRLLVGLDRPDAGTVALEGTGLDALRGRDLRRRRRDLHMVFQDPYSSLDPRMTIGASIGETIPRPATRLDRRAEVTRLLELVELDADLAGTFPAQLSGGQRQRVALARALAARPEVVIADEITSALDVSIQGTVLNLLRRLLGELGMSMLFISHNLAVVRYVASSIAVMYLGRIVEHGPAEAVIADPQHPYSRDLLAAVPESGHAGAVTAAAVSDAEPADPHHPPIGCRYHPRCPVGPLVRPDRERCRAEIPSTAHHHHAACHFAATGEPTARRSSS
jgi:peptide/nickel transport system ATP-binding protein